MSYLNPQINGGLLTKLLEIGDWDMDADISKSVSHGLTHGNIRGVGAFIRDDTGNNLSNFYLLPGGLSTGHNITVAGGFVVLQRDNLSSYNNTPYNTPTGFNRGWLVIQYIP
jgi:hypothetical protein